MTPSIARSEGSEEAPAPGQCSPSECLITCTAFEAVNLYSESLKFVSRTPVILHFRMFTQLE